MHSRVPCHIVHLSSASALPMIRKAREEGVPLTIETTHHYLSLLAENVPDGATQFKCCPPVRDANNQVCRSNLSTYFIEGGKTSFSDLYLCKTSVTCANLIDCALVCAPVVPLNRKTIKLIHPIKIEIACILFARESLYTTETMDHSTQCTRKLFTED